MLRDLKKEIGNIKELDLFKDLPGFYYRWHALSNPHLLLAPPLGQWTDMETMLPHFHNLETLEIDNLWMKHGDEAAELFNKIVFQIKENKALTNLRTIHL